MLVHKIDNKVNKESKTTSNKQGGDTTMITEKKRIKKSDESSNSAYLSDPLESYMIDYLEEKDQLQEESKSNVRYSKCLSIKE
jgi:hypothetical protein